MTPATTGARQLISEKADSARVQLGNRRLFPLVFEVQVSLGQSDSSINEVLANQRSLASVDNHNISPPSLLSRVYFL